MMEQRLPPRTSPSSDVEFDTSTGGHTNSEDNMVQNSRLVPDSDPNEFVPGGLYEINSLEVHFDIESPINYQRPPITMKLLDVLDCPDYDTTSGEHYVVSNAVRINGGRVYKASLELGGGTELDVALKFATGKKGRQQLVKEAKFYNEELLPVRGFLVPEYIGIFEVQSSSDAKSDDDEGEVIRTCLVVTYVGEVPPQPIPELPVKDRRLIHLSVIMLHALGVKHGDLHEGNIRLDPLGRTAWLIDFGRSEKHTCRHQKIEIGSDVPDPSEFGCREIFKTTCKTRMWISYGQWKFYSVPINLNYVDRWEDLVNSTPSSWPREKQVQAAKEGFQEVLAIKQEKRIEYQREHEWLWAEMQRKNKKFTW